MADASVAADFDQTFDVQSNFSSQVTFYSLSSVDDITDSGYFFICQISHSCIQANTCFIQNTNSAGVANAINISQADFYAFFSR